MTVPKIQIITMYCGEREYDNCKTSVSVQRYDGVIDHHCIENMSNVDAHKACYQMMMDGADKYDLFIKLDADMVFSRATAVHDIVKSWHKYNKPDHMVFAIQDFIPDRLSIGIHMFSNKCTWDLDAIGHLFVDPNPKHHGASVKVWREPVPFVTHAAHPSDKGAYHFGVHRALKALQPNYFWKRPQAITAFRILQSTARHYKRKHNPKVKLALMGAESVRKGLIKTKGGDKTDITIHETDIDFWLNPTKGWLWWWAFYGVRIIPIWLIRKIIGLFR